MALEKRMGHGEEFEFTTDAFRAIFVMELTDGGRFRAFNGDVELPRTGDRYALRQLTGPAMIEVRPDNEVFGNRAELYVRVQARDAVSGLVDLYIPPFKVAARDAFTPLTLLPTDSGVRVIAGEAGVSAPVSTAGVSAPAAPAGGGITAPAGSAPAEASSTFTPDPVAPPATSTGADAVHIVVDSTASMLRSTTSQQMDAMLSFAANAVSGMRCPKRVTTSSGQAVPGIVDTLEVPAGLSESLRGNDIGWEIGTSDIDASAAVIAISDDIPACLLGRSSAVHVISTRPVGGAPGVTSTLFDDRLHRAVAEGDARGYRDAIHALRGAIDAGGNS